MADLIDVANDLIAKEISSAINKIRKNSSQAAKGAKVCVECGESIPEARQKLGFTLCKPCAEEDERKKAMFAK